MLSDYDTVIICCETSKGGMVKTSFIIRGNMLVDSKYVIICLHIYIFTIL